MNDLAEIQDRIERELKRTTRRQGEASQPNASVWVSANAGTGKTHVLKMRVLRLLLDGTSPEKILCLTYTNAAAAEMATRVFDELSTWVTKDDADLAEEIEKLTQTKPTPEVLNFARTLFTTAIETPGGLKVQTFHAFCERLLQRFPLEADVSPGFTLLVDDQQQEVMRGAIDLVLKDATENPEKPNGQSLQVLIGYAADDRFDDLIAATLSDRNFQALANADATKKFDAKQAENSLRKQLGITAKSTTDKITKQMASVFTDETLSELTNKMLTEGSKSDQKIGQDLSKAKNSTADAQKADNLENVFLTAEKKPRARLLTKALTDAYQNLALAAQNAQETFHKLSQERLSLKKLALMMALTRLAHAVHERYTAMKALRSALDYDDLIRKTGELLSGDRATEWVLFKLDNGIEHVLVDESQDTSPQQWQVVETLAKEFFTGYGDHDDRKRTIFAVGDEKQSIYSFQGAVPHLFAEKGKSFQALSHVTGSKFTPIDLTLSFRTVAPILSAVDRVFSDPTVTPGVTRQKHKIEHAAKRAGQAGLVEIWPADVSDDISDADPWKPLDEDSVTSPVIVLANRIADTIRTWLDEKEILESQSRPITPGDILILVRKRHPFANPMVAALKQRGIPVAGADRMVLTDQIAVQDLLALGDFLTLPEDDLALACVLKSPMFDLTDDDLFNIGYGRKGTLWKALLEAAKSRADYRQTADRLREWRKRADFTPPFEFYSRLLDRDQMRHRFLTRLGTEAADPIDEMLNLALTYDEDAPPSLAGFVTWLRATNRTVKRDMDQGSDEVRVMTVHGAKGLEAPIVFLPDTCSTRTNVSGIRLLPWEKPDVSSDATTTSPSRIPFVWLRKEFENLAAVQAAKKSQQKSEIEERNRLLYVAMTRARDRLYIAGYVTQKKTPDSGCWYEIINERLSDVLSPEKRTDGREVLRLYQPQTDAPEAGETADTQKHEATALPVWAKKTAPTEPQLSIPLAPSRLAPYETDEEGDPVRTTPPGDDKAKLEASGSPPNFDPDADPTDFEAVTIDPQDPVPLPPTALADGKRFLRGNLTHALLEHLPDFDADKRKAAAQEFVKKRAQAVSKRVQNSIVKETLAVLEDPKFANLFGPNSRPEVTVAAEVPPPHGKGPPLRLSGQIDRLLVEDNTVHIVDFKTNRPPPIDASDVAEAYLLQLAAYRLALSHLYPHKGITCALLWTDGPRIMEIPGHQLDTATEKLWTLRTS